MHVLKGIVLKSNLLKCVLSPAQLWTHCWNLDLINSTWVLKWCDTFFRGFFPPHFLDQSLNHIHGNTEGKKKIPSNNSPSGNWKHLLKKKEPLGLWMLGIVQSLLPIPQGSSGPFSGRAVVIWASCPGDKCMLLVGFGLERSSTWICRQEELCVLITTNSPTEETKLTGWKVLLGRI